MNMPTKFDSYWTNGFREECQKQTAPILTLLGLLYFSNTSVQQKHDSSDLDLGPKWPPSADIVLT